jgi:hypothetical protein
MPESSLRLGLVLRIGGIRLQDDRLFCFWDLAFGNYFWLYTINQYVVSPSLPSRLSIFTIVTAS